jgi:hypothetical protein
MKFPKLPELPQPDADELGQADDPGPGDKEGSVPAGPDLSSLPVAGITRRRLGFLAGALISAWIVIVFARQVGDASAAAARVEKDRAANAALAGQLAALERESELIQRQEWVVQQAHAYRLGRRGEIPFTLGAADALPPNAPGSAAVRLGADAEADTPLEAWLSLLFGPGR